MSDKLKECGGPATRRDSATRPELNELHELDELDRALLDCVQRGIPLTRRPYAAVAQAVASPRSRETTGPGPGPGAGPGAGASDAVSEAEVLVRLRALLEAGVLRRIGPVFDSRALGYTGTLCGAQVRSDALEAVAEVVGSYPGVTHSYEREDEFNLWFTLLSATREAVTATVREIARQEGVERLIELPIERQFKIEVRFRLSADPSDTASPADSASPVPKGPANPARAASVGSGPESRDRAIIRVLQDGFPLEARPFEVLAERCRVAGVAIGAEELIAELERYRAVGYLRRLGGAVAHRRAGIRGNGMVVWQVPEQQIDELGAAVAEFPEVTHCYRRRPAEGWPYNLYAMVHAPTRSSCLERVSAIDTAIGRYPHRVLFSRREFKKTSMRYFCEDRRSDGRASAGTYPHKEDADG